MNIVVLSPVVCGANCGHGGGILSYGQLQRLAARHEVHFISFFKENDSGLHDPGCVEDLKRICASVNLVPLNTGLWQRVYSKLSLLLNFKPNDAAFLSSKTMTDRLREVVTKRCADVVLFQFPSMAQYVSACPDVSTVLDVHDAFSVSYFRKFRAEKSWLKRSYFFFIWLSWLRYEIHYYSRFDKLYTLTEQDRYGLQIFSPELTVAVIPAAVDVVKKMSLPAPLAKKSILFVGSFFHAPNIDAVRYFLGEVFPLVVQRLPDVEFVVVGKGADLYFKQYESGQVHFRGFVDDIHMVYASATIVVIPVRFGGGVKIKTIEAMANCCPMVSTSLGVEETGAQDDLHVMIADTPEDFAKKVVMLLQDDTLRGCLAKNARELALDRFSWESRTGQLEQLLEQAALLRRPGLS